MAWAVTNVAGLSDWRPAMERGFEVVPFRGCCSQNKALPAEFVAAVQARDSGLQEAPAQQAAGPSAGRLRAQE